jgi:AcrR family transcriptional regulator
LNKVTTGPMSLPHSGPPTPPPGGPSRRDGEATRARLVRSALDLFTTVGFRATTTTAIAEAAGVAEGTIYRHFTGKEELLNETYRQSQRWGGKILKEAEAEKGLTVQDRLMRVGRTLVEGAAKDRGTARMFLGAREERHLDEKSRETAKEFRDGLQHIVAMGKSDGLVRPGPADLWAAVWLALIGFAMSRVGSGDWAADHPQVQLTLEAAWDAIALKSGGAPPART